METTRRSFIAGAAAGAVALAASGAVAMATEADETPNARPWEVEPDPIDESLVAEELAFDVVVVGLGASGSYTATSAVENGLSVAVLERNHTFNANGGSHYMFNSASQREAGTDLDVEQAVRDFLNVCNDKVCSKNVWTWAHNAGEACDWFAGIVEPYGLRPVQAYSDSQPVTRIMPGTVNWIGGPNEPPDGLDNDPYNGDYGLSYVPQIDLLTALLEHMTDRGVQVFFGQTSQRLVKDANGRVCAVIAQDEDGVYRRYVGSKGIVIATGSYNQDPAMHDYYCTQVSHNPNAAGVMQFNMGDGSGIKQALWAGAAMQRNPDHPPMMFWGATNCIKNVMVNKAGKRFIDENTGQSNFAAAQFMQQDAQMFALWNEEYAQHLPAISWRPDKPEYALTPQQLVDRWEALVEQGVFMKADSLDEIADAYGIDAEQLAATVEQYNGFCEAGIDDDFHKDPATLVPLSGPFYAATYNTPASLGAMGGLHVNERSEVMDAQDAVIPGLYAVGMAAGDFYANQYSTRFAGNCLGRCMTFGYLLGRQLAE